MNNHETAHVRKLIEACEYQRLQWIEKGLRSPESDLPTEDFNEVFNMIEKQLKDLHEHLDVIEEKNRQIQEELGDDWRNELILCKNHHSTFDRNLFKFDEDNFSIIEIENGLNITKTNLKTLTGLQPHQDAFKYRYNS